MAFVGDGPFRDRRKTLRGIRRDGRQTQEAANNDQAAPAERATDENQGTKHMAETEAVKPKIQGLLATMKYRGLEGRAAIDKWTTSALEVLLQAELERINATNGEVK